MLYRDSNLSQKEIQDVMSVVGKEVFEASLWRVIPSQSTYCVNSAGTYIVRFEYIDSSNHVQLARSMKFYLAEYLEWQHGFVHSAVGEAFFSEFQPYPLRVVNHLDGNKFNNDVSNLEVCTPQENTAHFWSADCFKEARQLHSQRLSAVLKGRPSPLKGKKLGPDTSGRTHNKHTVAITKDGLNKLVDPQEVQAYLSDGWVRGQTQYHEITDELRARLSAAGKGHPAWNKGMPVSLEVRAKISKALRERIITDADRARMSERVKGEANPFYGKHHSPETLAKLSAMRKGKLHTEEQKQHLSAALSGSNNPMYGRKHSEESKQKMRDALKGRQGCNKDKVWITNGVDNKMVSLQEVDSYPSYRLGVSRPKVKRVWINNGVESKRIAESDINNYPGYVLGRLYSRKSM